MRRTDGRCSLLARNDIPVLLALLSLAFLAGCSSQTVRISGSVLRITGNQMPSPDMPSPDYAGYATHVYFHQPTHMRDARRAGPSGCYSRIGSPLAASAETDAKGNFRLRLAPGRYSVFIGRDSLFYANIFDGEGLLNPIEVKAGQRTRLLLKADWGAQY